MFTVTKYPHGSFSWADCSTSDAAAGKQFYADLMGWGFEDMPVGEGMNYTMFTRDGEYVAALSGMSPGEQMPPHWGCYVTVDDVDALVERVKVLGGSVFMEPFDIFDSGRMMVIGDPDGALLSLWQPRSHIGAGLVNTPGAMCWNELHTRDAEAAKAFYGELLGWSFTPEEQNYSLIQNGERMNGGIFSLDENMAARMPPRWLPYFSVADIKAAAERVKALGGMVLMGPHEAGQFGVLLLISDPQGAHSCLIQLREPQAWIE